ncbi:hypothetical protein PMI16_00396 [Herbaspirillum sp. CF444]|uniref:hypothetical protein n=1 Tax=Herbaspirillum sp. CF444 TaxID=1144319 RepID=UPI0002725D25|nr:hypothetical protein [Herbaspirillum sp. CF444]EJL94041.1 hypothetical protein PMI16_00396 [Herbaspirillum sp. CF444]
MEYQSKPGPGASDRATDKATDSAGETHADGSSARAASFVDVRPVMARDRQLMQMMRANADTHVDVRKQAAAPPAAAKPVLQPKQMSRLSSSRSPIQLATKVTGAKVGGVASEATHTEGYFAIDPDRQRGVYAEVGTKMTATLYKQSPLKGSPVGNQWLWMDALKKRANTTVIRGHLLNHDLGGRGLPYNLFPISNAANQEHSNKVEQRVKGLLYGGAPIELDTKNIPLTYEVEVTNRDDKALKATFHCTWSYLDKKESHDVHSDLNVKAKFSMAGPVDEKTGKPIPKIVPPDAWKKGQNEKITDQKSINVKVNRKDPRFRNGGKLRAGGLMSVHIEGVVEGSDYVKTPYWQRQLGSMDFSQKYVTAIGKWVAKKEDEKIGRVEINDALDFAVDQIDPVERRAPTAVKKRGKGTLSGKYKDKIAQGPRRTTRIIMRSFPPTAGDAKYVRPQGKSGKTGKAGAAKRPPKPVLDARQHIVHLESIRKQRKEQEEQYMSDIDEAIKSILAKAEEALANKS